MRNLLKHFFLPQESNNHRAKMLHHKSLLTLILFLFLGQFALVSLRTYAPDILGSSVDISSQQLLLLTNQKRQVSRLSPLVLNNQLSQAAMQKAKDMFAKNYWAHNAPDGTTPWVFFKRADYDYIYAGENLARGFAKPEDVVNAWMASPTHKENMLSQNYQEVGFAVLEGTLFGEKTTLVVEMFGNRNISTVARGENTNPETLPLESQGGTLAIAVKNTPLVDSRIFSENIAVLITMLCIMILMLDMMVIERKKIVRFVGHNMDHTFFLGAIFLIIAALTKGAVL